MVGRKENAVKGKADGVRREKAGKACNARPVKDGANEWNTLTAFRNFTRCIGFASLLAFLLVVFRIFPSISFGFFDQMFAVLGLAAFFGSIGFIPFTVYGGKEPYQSTHAALDAAFALLYLLVSTFGVVALLTLVARQPDMGEFYDGFGGTVMQYTKMMPVFGLFTGLTLSFAYSRLFQGKEAGKVPARPGKERAKPQRAREPALARDDQEKHADEQAS